MQQTRYFRDSFIHPWLFLYNINSYYILQVIYYSEALRHSTDTVLEFHPEAPQATASEGFAQGPYVAARAGVEPTTLRAIGIDSTNEPPCPVAI